MIWWHVEDGVAVGYPDTRETKDRVDREGGRDWYGTIEGAILHGGVQATAFERRIVKTYDAVKFFQTGEMVPAGELDTIKITARPR